MLYDREILEANEQKVLAAYAAFAADSRGRSFPEEESNFRTAFQKDRDRVIHTSAFRRLEYKTQVFVNNQGDYYRTRLTHTLEVAQVAKSISRALGLNEDLTETIALAHDLGHPPFGHAGERALNRLAKEVGGFDHNKQSLRVVTKLENRYKNFLGLNLSWETLEGIMKHEIDLDAAGEQWEDMWEPNLQPTLEAQIVDLSDAIAYNAHDLDDGLASGHVEPEQLTEVELIPMLLDRLEIKVHDLRQRKSRFFLIRELLGEMIGSAIRATNDELEARNVKTLDDIRAAPKKLAGLEPEMKRMTKELKSFLYQNLYFHFRQKRMGHKAEHILERIFAAYHEEPKMLPFEVQDAIEDVGLTRAVTDYMSMMTDRYAADEFRKLFEPHTLT